MNDLREALDHILRICHASRTYTRRTQQIHEVAMQGLGMTAGQRKARHLAIMDRVGGEPAKQAYLARIERRRAKIEAREAARQQTE